MFNVLEIVIKTIVTTVNLILLYVLYKGGAQKEQSEAFKFFMVMLALNLVGIWI